MIASAIENLNNIALCKIDDDDDKEYYYRLYHVPSGFRIPGDYYRLECAQGCLREISQLKIPADGVSISEEIKAQALEIITKWRNEEGSWPAQTADGRKLFENIKTQTPISIQKAITGWVWSYSSVGDLVESSEAFASPEAALFDWIQWANREIYDFYHQQRQ